MNVQLPKPVSMLLAGLLTLLPVLAGADTLERVRANNTFTLGYLPDFAPFSSQDGDKASGYGIELCLKVADRLKTELSLPNLQVRYQALKVGEEISAVSSGKVDILCTPTPATLERRKSVSFSIPVYTAGLSAVVRNDAPESLLRVLNGDVAHTGPTWRATVNRGLANHTFAAVAGGVTEAWLREKMRLLGVVATLVTVENNEDGVKLVADGKANAFLSERMLLNNYVAKSKDAGELMVVGRLFEFAPASMALERGDEDFRLLVDTVLSEMYRSGEIEQAYIKYLDRLGGTSKLLFKVYALP
ncbi:amino acid ABC transporter substrate-binding protein [Pseudomonas cavernicola]|uniref:Amino acid ABC transporter substrate-binding protein n=1 Tax=Pseudomonas cavernicola TaxID=2320866 RepID=A0A418XEB2_9PSED|nr:amino acid ABC transporter substrate-binding protein [Pseudomonas cavernicola]RJG10872.1 amino acid ABC transporter substrate-binding protein [Pseudomonas cavernicola]